MAKAKTVGKKGKTPKKPQKRGKTPSAGVKCEDTAPKPAENAQKPLEKGEIECETPPETPQTWTIRDRVKGLVRVAAGELLADPRNFRTHSPAQAEAFQRIARTVGFAGAILARQTPAGLMMIDGHLRQENVPPAEKVPVLVLDVTEAEAAQLLATYDQLGAMAGRDSELLAGLLKDLKAAGDTLAAAVWPDFIMDPLMSAEWKPAATADLPTRVEKASGYSLALTAEQEAVFKRAAEEVRNGPLAHLTDAEALVYICDLYVNGP